MNTAATPIPTSSRALEATRWRIDPARSNVSFQTPTLWGRAIVNGRFERYDGTLDLRREPAIELAIDGASVDTNNKFRDKHLRGADFFDAANHPEVRFVSSSVLLAGDQLKVRGRLSTGGRSMPIELEATLRRVGDELEVDASTHVDHRELGMTHSTLGMIRTPSELNVHARLVADPD
jgi:polyisoprenoid-binding protein YceI